MAVTTAIAIYLLFWWLTLFAVLPWGVRAQGEESTPGTDPGAPVLPQILAKLIWTTVISMIVFAIVAYLYISGLVTLDDLMALMGISREFSR